MDHSRQFVSANDTVDNKDITPSQPMPCHELETILATRYASSPFPEALPDGGTGMSVSWGDIKPLELHVPFCPYKFRYFYGPNGIDDDSYGKAEVTIPAGRACWISILAAKQVARQRLGWDWVLGTTVVK